MKLSVKHRLNFYRVLFVLIILAGVFQAGSYIQQTKNRPDLHRLYMQSTYVSDQPPVVFIHGVTGSKLRHAESGAELFPGSFYRNRGLWKVVG